MKLLFTLLLIGLLIAGTVTAYYHINEDDNPAVKEFKSNTNRLALQNDIDNGLTEEGLRIKLKYFWGDR